MGKIISILGTGNQAESSTIGVNLSVALAAQTKTPAALIGFDGNSLDELEVFFNLRPSKSIEDIIQPRGNAGETIFARHTSDVDIAGFAGPFRFEKEISARLNEFIASVSENYPYTLLLCPKPGCEEIPLIAGISDIMLLVITPDCLSLKRAKTILGAIKSNHFSFEMIKPVILDDDSGGAISEEDIERFLGLNVFRRLTFERGSTASGINTGRPVVFSEPSSRFSSGIIDLSKMLIKLAITEKKIARGRAESQVGSPEEKTRGAKRLDDLKETIHKRIIEEIDVKSVDLKDPEKIRQNRAKAAEIICDMLSRESENEIPRELRPAFVEELLDEVFGLGCLEKLLDDPEITEIMVNGPETVYVEKGGKIHGSGARFSGQGQLLTVIDRIVSPLGRRIDESSPIVDARLPDGSRVNAVIPPISLVGPVITIRKFAKKKLTVEDLVNFGALTAEMAEFLKTCVLLRKNIVISGGTGSGKTTLLNVMSSFIPEDERILTIEDSAELNLPQAHVVRLEARPPSIEGAGEVPIRRLVITALRMRPDRIVVGECRGGEALDMLQAMNTGHDGSMTTVHANSPKDAVSRIATMVMMAGMDLPDKAIKEQIASAVRIIIQLSRLSDGSRKIVQISELGGGENGAIKIAPLFEYARSGIIEGRVVGKFEPAGTLPDFFDEIEQHGLKLDKKIFFGLGGK
ncbi:MAG: ATPase, T2SS/T4P/T4SS family [Elusimicrobiota bacterium]